jgi:hypothetical protein
MDTCVCTSPHEKLMDAPKSKDDVKCWEPGFDSTFSNQMNGLEISTGFMVVLVVL